MDRIGSLEFRNEPTFRDRCLCVFFFCFFGDTGELLFFNMCARKSGKTTGNDSISGATFQRSVYVLSLFTNDPRSHPRQSFCVRIGAAGQKASRIAQYLRQGFPICEAWMNVRGTN